MAVSAGTSAASASRTVIRETSLESHSLVISTAVAPLLLSQSNQTTVESFPDSHSTIHGPAFQILDCFLLCYQEFQGRQMVSGCFAVLQPVDFLHRPLFECPFPVFDRASASLTRYSHGSSPGTNAGR